MKRLVFIFGVVLVIVSLVISVLVIMEKPLYYNYVSPFPSSLSEVARVRHSDSFSSFMRSDWARDKLSDIGFSISSYNFEENTHVYSDQTSGALVLETRIVKGVYILYFRTSVFRDGVIAVSYGEYINE